eukprot:CAMPEP_0184750578 /NCGR_PEP_ID=MMETSP0315-20130426/37360_1 /TAXON_ID=101924 /ORGANISM="Rhodosorus marinus, Strain UTEX LB 2760" /LENGTH=65 /DNA_ID=CAMNT_0027228949 /DNA_START=89 /DNA_END=283 /DNA_ORIENTATION=-
MSVDSSLSNRKVPRSEVPSEPADPGRDDDAVDHALNGVPDLDPGLDPDPGLIPDVGTKNLSQESR